MLCSIRPSVTIPLFNGRAWEPHIYPQKTWLAILVQTRRAFVPAMADGAEGSKTPASAFQSPQNSRPGTPLDSPAFAVRELLNDTSLAKPPTSPANKPHRRKSRRSTGDGEHRDNARPASAEQSVETPKQSFQTTMNDLQSLLLQYLRLLPWFPPDHPIVWRLSSFPL